MLVVCYTRHCQDAIIKLADVLGWGVAVLHDAKGMFPEGHPSFLGTYSPFYTSPVSVKQCYEAADAILFIGERLTLCNLLQYRVCKAASRQPVPCGEREASRDSDSRNAKEEGCEGCNVEADHVEAKLSSGGDAQDGKSMP